jgi:hypothetical protein
MKKLYVLFAVISIYFTGFSQLGPTSSVLSGDTTICIGATTNLTIEVTDGTAPYTVTVTDGTNTYSATGVSPVSIPVSPSATSTYTIVSVTGGGTGTGNTGSAIVTVTPAPAQPTLACYETTQFDVDFCEWVCMILTASLTIQVRLAVFFVEG